MPRAAPRGDLRAARRPRAARHCAARCIAPRPLVFLAPPLLTALFLIASARHGDVEWGAAPHRLRVHRRARSLRLGAGPGPAARPSALDFAAILLLWMPLEFPAGAAHLIAKHAQGFLHSVAYGIAILLGLILFLGFRAFDGMKYNPPRSRRDLWLPLAAYALTAPVLMLIGIWIGFIPAPHLPTAGAGKMAAAAAIIFRRHRAPGRDPLPRHDPEPTDAALRPGPRAPARRRA